MAKKSKLAVISMWLQIVTTLIEQLATMTKTTGSTKPKV